MNCIRRAIGGALLLMAVVPAASADALRCGARVVSTGMLAAEVTGLCGEPVYRDAWWYPQRYTGAPVADTEEWYYNFGPSQLLRILRFRDGALVAVDSDGYGYVDSAPRACAPADLVEGLSKFRLLLRCGEPATREAYALLRPLRDPHTGRVHDDLLQSVYHERWVYNLGATYLLRIVTLENGRITDVTTGDRGTDP